jgi:Flp pilus assembly protein TadD
MSSYASGTTLQNLSLVEDGLPPVTPAASDPPAPAASLAPAASPAPSAPGPANRAAPGPDRFLAEAAREYESGRVEQPLWVRAVDQAGGDAEGAKAAYLRARAAALRLERRARHGGPPAGGETAATSANERTAAPARAPVGNRVGRRAYLAGGALGALVAVTVVGWFALSGSDDAPRVPAVAAPAPKASSSLAGSAKKKEATPEKGSVLPTQDFPAKIREFREASNWHLLVLYAVEWTRAQPGNPEAWQDLAFGYMKLRQFEDAQEAARKATQLGPDDYRRWQELGLIDVALNQAVPALAAFEHAIGLNPRDVTSHVQIGALRAEQGHWPEARAAYAKALEVSPNDVDALCGSAALARKEGRAKDADGLLRQVAAGGGNCPAAEALAPPPAPAPKERGSYGLPSVTPAPASAVPPKKR